MGRILREFGGGVLEVFQGLADGVGHGYVEVFYWVVPIYGHYAVLSTRPIDGDGVILLECINDVGGVVGGREFNAKVVYSKSEDGG